MQVQTLKQINIESGIPKIGAAHHLLRNLWLFVGVVVVAAAMAGYYRWQKAKDAAAMESLASFQAAYAQKCLPSAPDPTSSRLAKDLYLRSSTLRTVVDRQLDALQNGVDCETVTKALRAADFPMPLLPSKPPTINLQPPQVP